MRKLAKLLSHTEDTIFKGARREESEQWIAKLKQLDDYKLVFVMTIKTHIINFSLWWLVNGYFIFLIPFFVFDSLTALRTAMQGGHYFHVINIHQMNVKILIIDIKKFLDCDCLIGMQFLGNTVQKIGNWVQKKVINTTFWLASKQRNSLRANQMRHLNGAKIWIRSGPVSSKNRNGWRLQRICFCDQNNCRGAEKLL